MRKEKEMVNVGKRAEFPLKVLWISTSILILQVIDKRCAKICCSFFHVNVKVALAGLILFILLLSMHRNC